MNQKSEARVLEGAKILSTLIFAATVAFIFCHEPNPAIPNPDDIPATVKAFEHMDAKSATADALKEIISMFTALALGLGALAGYGLKDGFGERKLLQATNLVMLSLFVMCLVVVLTQAYEGYGTLALQLDSGYLFVTLVQKIIVSQIEALLGAAATAFSILFINLWFSKSRTNR